MDILAIGSVLLFIPKGQLSVSTQFLSLLYAVTKSMWQAQVQDFPAYFQNIFSD
jgi:hypothetical protein